MSPEYAMDGAFSVKSDIYSFGVILLEIISGLKITLTRFTCFPNLLAYVSTVSFLKFSRYNKTLLLFYQNFTGSGVELMARW